MSERIETCSTASFDDARLRLVRIHRSWVWVPGLLVALGGAGLAGCLDRASDPVAGEPASVSATMSLSQVLAAEADYVPVPGGVRVHSSCVHELAEKDLLDQSAGVIRSANGDVKAVASPCAFPALKLNSPELAVASVQQQTDGWVEDAHWEQSFDMRQFGASFHVPAFPNVYTGQTVFFFNALETNNWDSILQPVLQYGPNCGGPFWCIASWYGGAEWQGNYYHSPVLFLSRNDNPLRGGIWWTNDCGPGGCVWHIATCGSQCTETAVRSDRIWSVLFGASVEVYRVNDCNEYPATYEDFYDFFIQDERLLNPTPSWTANVNIHNCGARVDIVSPNLINTFYNTRIP